MKIATYNVNGVNGRIGVLLRWLAEAQPDVVCLQELKAQQEMFPAAALQKLGYEALWHGQPRWNGVAILSRVGAIHETPRGLPGDPDPSQSRYIEAAVNGVVVAGLYLPNGNPRPGPKFDYKLAWFDRLLEHAAFLLETGAPVVLAGDFNVIPTKLDVYKPERWLADALFAPEVRAAFAELLEQGWPDALRALHPDETKYTFWDYYRNGYAAMQACASIICCSVLLSLIGCAGPKWMPMCADGRRPAITRPSGSNRLQNSRSRCCSSWVEPSARTRTLWRCPAPFPLSAPQHSCSR